FWQERSWHQCREKAGVSPDPAPGHARLRRSQEIYSAKGALRRAFFAFSLMSHLVPKWEQTQRHEVSILFLKTKQYSIISCTTAPDRSNPFMAIRPSSPIG